MGVRTWTGFEDHRIMPQPEHLKGAKRGTVKGFSRNAANRLRNLLFPLDYRGAFGIALTAPPWATVSPEAAFDVLSKTKSRCRGLLATVWRKEVTRNGIPHYHVIVFLENPESFQDRVSVQAWLVREWSRALLPRVCPVRVRLCCKAKNLPGDTATARYMVERTNSSKENLTLITSANAVQYLADHTSKHKDYQARTTGRAWGVWFKDRLPVLHVPGHNLDELPARIVRRVQKALGKMSRYFIRDKDAAFGYRWSHERKFTGLGGRVLFKPGAADALARLVDYYLAADAFAGIAPSVP